MSQNCYKRFKPNITEVPAQFNFQEQTRFKRSLEDENHDCSGSKRRSQDTDSGWIATKQQQQHGYQNLSRRKNNIENLLQEW